MNRDPDRYLVPARDGRCQHSERRSRFIAVATHTSTEEDAQALLQRERRAYHDAAHHCFAWHIGDSERTHDDGEPAGTAGRPILDGIHGAGLHEVTVVVTRYFGGVKLGTGGLARAYGDAARAALAEAGVQERFRTGRVIVSFEHGDTSAVHHVAGRHGARQTGAAYGDRVALQFELNASRVAAFRTAVIEATHGRAEVHDAEI